MKIIYIGVFAMIVVLSGCDTPVSQTESYGYTLEEQMGCFCPQGGVWASFS